METRVGPENLKFSLGEMPGAMVFATHRIIVDCNARFAGLFGYRREDILQTSFARLYPEISDFIRIGKLWDSNFQDTQIYRDERIMKGSSGVRFWCAVEGRSRNARDPFAEALYSFSPIHRRVVHDNELLTPRQRQILAMIAQGKTNRQIGKELSVSVRTAEMHRLRLCRSLGVRNTAELVSWFSSANVLSEELVFDQARSLSAPVKI